MVLADYSGVSTTYQFPFEANITSMSQMGLFIFSTVEQTFPLRPINSDKTFFLDKPKCTFEPGDSGGALFQQKTVGSDQALVLFGITKSTVAAPLAAYVDNQIYPEIDAYIGLDERAYFQDSPFKAYEPYGISSQFADRDFVSFASAGATWLAGAKDWSSDDLRKKSAYALARVAVCNAQLLRLDSFSSNSQIVGGSTGVWLVEAMRVHANEELQFEQ